MLNPLRHLTRIIPAPRARRLAKPALMVAGALALGACATVPQPLAGTYPPLAPTQATQAKTDGTPVRWGGQIIKTRPEADQTCFFMLSRPLDDTARPLAGSASEGRFVACHAGFYDPEVFVKGREVTFTGTLDGSVTDPVGKFDYTYPRVQAQTVYLWPVEPRVVRYRDPFYDPFWGPVGPWRNPYWYQPRVRLIHRVPHRPPHHHHRPHGHK